jgi:hypothetical protein
LSLAKDESLQVGGTVDENGPRIARMDADRSPFSIRVHPCLSAAIVGTEKEPMQANLNTPEIEQAIAWNTAVQMMGAILAGPQLNYRITSLFLSGDDRRRFVSDFMDLVQADAFPPYWRKCLSTIKPRAEASLAILIVGFKQTNRPDGVDCGVCGATSCEDFYRLNDQWGREALCPLGLMTFCDAISRGLQMAHLTYLASLSSLTQSLGKAALALKMIDADFALGILLELGQIVKTTRENE